MGVYGMGKEVAITFASSSLHVHVLERERLKYLRIIFV